MAFSLDVFWTAPPVARTYAALTFFLSLAAACQLISPYTLIYHHEFILRMPPQIWRLVTAMCFTSQLGIIFMPYTIWQYAVPLERDSPRFSSASFLMYLTFVGSCIILLAGEVLGSPIFTGAMMVAIAYTFAQEHRGQTIQFFVVPIEVKYLPYVMMLITLLQGGTDAAMAEATAIPAAHMYDFLTSYWSQYGGGMNLLPTPALLERMFEGMRGARTVQQKGHGTSFQPSGPRVNTSSATSSGVSNPLSFQGRGRRLGGT